MRRLLAVAAIGLASVAYGVGLGSSTALTAADHPVTDTVAIADRGDGGYCPFDRTTEETSA